MPNKKGVEVCARCNTPISFENVTSGYYGTCPHDDEDLLELEVILLDEVPTQLRKIPVEVIGENCTVYWTLEEVLEAINSDRFCGWVDYDSSDWVEGWREWVAPNGFYSIAANHLQLDYFLSGKD